MRALASHQRGKDSIPVVVIIIGTLRYEAKMETAVNARNFRGPRSVAADKMLKMCIFVKEYEVNTFFFFSKNQ